MMLTRQAIAEKLLLLPDAIAAAEQSYTAAEAEREEFEASLILSGKINGGNAETRKAQLTVHTQEFEAEVNRQRVELHRLQNQLAALRSVARVIGGTE